MILAANQFDDHIITDNNTKLLPKFAKKHMVVQIMHLGVNLRKAFLNGILPEDTDSSRHHPVDTIL